MISERRCVGFAQELPVGRVNPQRRVDVGGRNSQTEQFEADPLALDEGERVPIGFVCRQMCPERGLERNRLGVAAIPRLFGLGQDGQPVEVERPRVGDPRSRADPQVDVSWRHRGGNVKRGTDLPLRLVLRPRLGRARQRDPHARLVTDHLCGVVEPEAAEGDLLRRAKLGARGLDRQQNGRVGSRVGSEQQADRSKNNAQVAHGRRGSSDKA